LQAVRFRLLAARILLLPQFGVNIAQELVRVRRFLLQHDSESLSRELFPKDVTTKLERLVRLSKNLSSEVAPLATKKAADPKVSGRVFVWS